MISAALWTIWKLRNEICFQNVGRKGMDILINKVARLAQNWLILCPENKETLTKTTTRTYYHGGDVSSLIGRP
jgi:hypothetical protein